MANVNIFEELAPYARLTIPGSGVTVGQLNYVTQQDLYYTCEATFTSGVVPANTQLQFFQAALGDSATNAGYSSGTITTAQSDSRFPRGQAAANQCFVGTSMGFSVNTISAATPDSGFTVGLFSDPDDVYSLAQNFSWDLTIGRGIQRIIGPLAAYPGNDSVTVLQNQAGTAQAVTGNNVSTVGTVQLGKPSCGFTRLVVPIVFPPLINVTINAQNGSGFTLESATTVSVQFRLTLRGYLMTMPVG